MGAFFLIVSLLLQGAAIQTTRGGTISGRLTSVRGVPAARVRIGAILVPDTGVSRSADDFMSPTETDAEGRYLLENLPSGNYLIAVGPVGAPYYYPGVTTRSDAKVVAVSGNGTIAGVDFVLKGVTVRGRIIPSSSQIEFAIPELMQSLCRLNSRATH